MDLNKEPSKICLYLKTRVVMKTWEPKYRTKYIKIGSDDFFSFFWISSYGGLVYIEPKTALTPPPTKKPKLAPLCPTIIPIVFQNRFKLRKIARCGLWSLTRVVVGWLLSTFLLLLLAMCSKHLCGKFPSASVSQNSLKSIRKLHNHIQRNIEWFQILMTKSKSNFWDSISRK